MKYFSLIITVFLFSCDNGSSKTNFLTGGKIKYWDIIEPDGPIQYCYSFSKQGECIYYVYYLREKCKGKQMYEGDMAFEDTWILKNDSTLNFRSFDRKILILNEDTVLTEYKGIKTLLVKSKCQELTPQNN